MDHSSDEKAIGLAMFNFTTKQGEYLTFIHAYTCVMGQPPAEADMQRYFEVTPPTIHQMVLTLERDGLIKRTPRAARSIQVLVPPEQLPTIRDRRSTDQNH